MSAASGIPQEFNSGQRARVVALREAAAAIQITRLQGVDYDLMALTQWILDGKDPEAVPVSTVRPTVVEAGDG